MATIDFTPSINEDGKFRAGLRIYLVAKNEVTYDNEFVGTGGVAYTTVMNTIRTSLRSNGWVIEDSGDKAIIIRGYRRDSDSPLWDPKAAGAFLYGTDPAFAKYQPHVITDSGVRRAEYTGGGKWKLTFRALDPDNPTAGGSAIVRVTVQADGSDKPTVVEFRITPQMTATSAASTAYKALGLAGIDDVELQGDSVIWLHDARGAEASYVTVEYIWGDDYGFRLGTVIGIAEREILP